MNIPDPNWSERDDHNAENAPLGWPPGLPAKIELIGQMMMGAIKRFWNKANPVYLTTGTLDAYIVTTEGQTVVLNLYEIIRVRIDRANTTTTPTLKFAKTNARTIVKVTSAGVIPLIAGDMQAGRDHSFWFNGTNFILSNPATIDSSVISGLGAGVAAWLGTPTSANLAAAVTDETGSGGLVFANTPTLVTPVLGAATGTSLNLSGLTASNAVATDASKNLVSVANTGSGSNVLATSPTLVTPTIGAATGTSLNLSGLTASNAVATDGSKNLVSVANTGTGNNVLAISPALTGSPTAPTQTQADNSTKLATTAYVDTGLSGVQVAPRNIVPFLTSTTWTAPASVTRVRAQVWAGGGGGGGAGDTTNTVAGAPGAGSGEYREGTFTVVPGTVYTITIGAAGAAGSSAPANGGSGGNSIFDAFCTAIGGSGSTAVLNSIVGTIPPGGTGGSGGQIALAGSPGNQALLYGAATVGGGIGGSPAFGRGINSPSLNGAGAAGLFPGGGGTGGSSVTNGVGNAGGAGAAGYIILSY